MKEYYIKPKIWQNYKYFSPENLQEKGRNFEKILKVLLISKHATRKIGKYIKSGIQIVWIFVNLHHGKETVVAIRKAKEQYSKNEKKTGDSLRDALRGRIKCISKLIGEGNRNNTLRVRSLPDCEIIPNEENERTNIVKDDYFAQQLMSHLQTEEKDQSLIGDLDEKKALNKTYNKRMIEPEKEWRKIHLDDNIFLDLLGFFSLPPE